MEDCLFCKIIAGQIPADIVYEDEYAVAFRDIAPAAPVHILVVPRRHVSSILEASGCPGLMDHLLEAVANVARAQSIDGPGFRMVANTGADAGQTVHHLHLHLLAGKTLGPMA